jgi:hypothetical protein
MHLLERYASSCGVKIGKPYIYDSYFPVTSEKFITFQPFSKPAKNYDYWQEVVDIILPYLKQNNIDIIQIGAKEDRPINGTISVSGQTTISQAAFLIKKSIMHLGADSFAVHIASGFNKKIVALYSNNNVENVKPYWSDEKDICLISPIFRTLKPSYSLGENPKNINNIKPEEIAISILNLLNIKHNINQKTIYFGPDYNNKTLEIIPDKPIDPKSIPIENPIIRMDYFFNEQVLAFYLQFKKCIIFTDKEIDPNLIRQFKSNISQVVYFIDENNNPEFVKFLKNNGIEFTLISFLKEEELNKYKLNYMDYGLIHLKQKPTKDLIKLKELPNNLYYKSSTILISSEGQFTSKFDWINKNKNKVIDNIEFWKEVDNFYIFSID